MDEATLHIRHADSFLARLGGLLVLPPLGDDEALCLRPCSSVHTCFMRHAIDVAFLNRAGTVLKVRTVPPWRAAWCPGAHVVLELREGAAVRHRVVPGATLAQCGTSGPHGRHTHAQRPRRHGSTGKRVRGATLVEALIVLPIFFFAMLALLQAALVFHARSNVNYATFEAARAGTLNGASIGAINAAFQKAMLPYYGGGTSEAELVATAARVATDLTSAAVRVELLSPTAESFQDYNSPALQARLKTSDPVIPNAGLDELTCPRDVKGCASNPDTNASGQTLLDANLLKLRITYGLPTAKQMPLVGPFYTWALGKLGAGGDDAFKQTLIAAHRIPVVSSVVMRMQSDAVKNSAMASSPGPGNHGHPVEPTPAPPTSEPTLPSCQWWDPSCSSCPDGQCETQPTGPTHSPAPGPTPDPPSDFCPMR